MLKLWCYTLWLIYYMIIKPLLKNKIFHYIGIKSKGLQQYPGLFLYLNWDLPIKCSMKFKTILFVEKKNQKKIDTKSFLCWLHHSMKIHWPRWSSLRGQVFGFFWPPTPLGWQFLSYKLWQKVDIFGLPTNLFLST